MRPRSSTLTDHQLELVRIIWERGEATVRDVYDDLLRRRRIAYTTVMTTMKTLEQKGYLKASQQDRAFLYRPAQPKAKVLKDRVRHFIDRVFEGSAQPLLVHLLKERHISESDVAFIGRQVKQGNTKQSRRERNHDDIAISAVVDRLQRSDYGAGCMWNSAGQVATTARTARPMGVL